METGLLIALPVIALADWFIVPRKANKTPRLFILLVWTLAFAELLPGPAKVAVSTAALLGGFIWWFNQPVDERRGPRVVSWSVAILVYWTLLLVLHPNVPSLPAGVLGWRQTVFALGGLVLGCAVPRRHLAGAERTVIVALSTALAVSLVSFFWVPSLSQMVARTAGEYTDLFQGKPRLEGIFAGPFHVATGAVVLIAWVLTRGLPKRRRLLTVGVLVIASLSLRYAAVRTAYVAVVFVVVALVFLARKPGGFFGRTVMLVALAGIGYYAVVNGGGALQSLSTYSTDQRLLNRLPGYQEALHMIGQSPFFGWGPGSAGDTLDVMFAGYQHVTPHNLLLKIAVEGGAIGCILWFGLAKSWWRSITPRSNHGKLAAVAVLALLVFGITGSAIDALPMSYFVLLLAGLAVGVSADGPEYGTVEADHDAPSVEFANDRGEVGLEIPVLSTRPGSS